MKNLKARFTRWYVRRGYKFGYRKDLTAYYVCPVWVKPLLPFLFSPGVYAIEAWGKTFVKGFEKSMKEATESFTISFSEFTKAVNRIAERGDDNATQYEKQ